MLWALGLENAAAIFNTVGDTSRATWATQTAADLRTGLADYRTSDNGYYFGIKTNSSFYNDFITAPTNLIAARFMDDNNAFNYLKTNATVLSLAGIPWVNVGSTTYKSGVTNLIDIGTWFEIMWGELSKRWGDGDQYDKIITMTGLGYVPVSLRASNSDFIIGQHIENQTWSYGLLLGMIYNNNYIYPVVSGTPSVNSLSTGATISWTTKNNSSSIIDYGLTSSYGNSTTEADTATRVSSHTVNLSSLASCTHYHYRVRSKNVHGLMATSNDGTFTTTGCTGSAAIISQTDANITTAAGGNINLLNSGQGISLTVPASFAGSDANFQIKQLDKTATINTTSTPIGYSTIGNYVYELSALSDISTKITTFNKALTISINYASRDVSGIDESTLKIYRWDGRGWNQLSDCSVNTSTKTVTCTTTNFSTFVLFGQASSSGSSSSSSSSSSGSSSVCSDQAPGNKAPWLYGAIAQDSGSILLYFTEADEPVDKYVLAFGTKSGDYPWGSTNIGGKGTRTYLVQSLSPNTTYYFKIRAGNGCATGPWSNEISATTKSRFTITSLDITESSLEPISCTSSYRVKKGDTLWTIAQKLLGSGINYKKIIQTNSSLNEEAILQIGQEIIIPCLSSAPRKEQKQLTEEEKQTYKLTVKVVDKKGLPVAGAKVILHSTVQEKVTDKEGVAVFSDVEKGDHRLVIAYKNYQGEQSINLQGNVKEFKLTVTVIPANVFLTKPTLILFGFLSAVIVFLCFVAAGRLRRPRPLNSTKL